MKDAIWFLIAGIIGAVIFSQLAEAEDCLSFPPEHVNYKLYPTIEMHRGYNPNRRLQAQAKRRAESRTVSNMIYFYGRTGGNVGATLGSLGYDLTAGYGAKKNVDIALLIAQGHEAGDFDGSWDEEFILEEHLEEVYWANCRQRNYCRRSYKDRSTRALCFQDLKNWPEIRTYLPNLNITTFGEIVTIYAK
jgi:hypothetical protein